MVLAKSCKGRVVRTPVKTAADVDFTKDYSKPDSMVQVRVAKQRIERGLGFTTGMKVSYVVTDAAKPPMAAVPWPDTEEEQAKVTYDERSTPNDWRRPLVESPKPSVGKPRTSWPATSKRVCSPFSPAGRGSP